MMNAQLGKIIILLEAVLGCFQLQGMQGITADAGLYHSAQKRQNQGPRFVNHDITAIEGDGTKDVCILGGSTAVEVMLRTNDSCVDGYPQDIYHACEGSDFIGISETFTISPGERRCFDLTIVDDSVVENGEQFVAMLRGANTNTDFGVISVYIVNNDYGPVLAPPPAYQNEDIGTVEICVLGGTVTVPVVLNTTGCTYDGCATEDKMCGSGSEGWCFSDYIGLNETFTIGPGERRCFTITIGDDLIIEKSEDVYISLKAVSPHVLSSQTSSRTSFQIVDNDAPTLEFPSRFDEDIGSVDICVLGGTVAVPILLRTTSCYNTPCASEGSDYTRLNTNATIISAGERRCFIIDIMDDTIAERNESFEIRFETAELPHSYLSTFYLYIVDNDVPTLEIPITSIDEDVGSVEVCVVGGAATVPVVLSTSDYCGDMYSDTACEGSDYTGINETVTISAGERRCYIIDIMDDLLVEEEELFYVKLEITTESGSLDTFSSTTPYIYITDNDAPTLELPFDPKFAIYEFYYDDEYDVTVYEDIGSVDVCVLGGATAVPVVLGISDYYCMEYNEDACRGSDYIFNNKSFMIQPGERRCFAITIVDDLIAEEMEDIGVNLQTAVAPNVFLGEVYFDIADNDVTCLPKSRAKGRHVIALGYNTHRVQLVTSPMGLELPGSRYVELGSSTSTIVEGTGTVSVCLIGGVDTAPLTLTTECEVDGPNYCYQYDACDDVDFICINETFTVSPGERRCFDLTIVDDSVPERTEYFHVLLEGAGGEEYYYWVLDIKDNDAPYLEQTSYTVGEGDGSVEVCVRYEGHVDLIVAAAISTTDDTALQGADYVEKNEIFNIGYGERKCFNISIIDDTLFEPGRQHFRVKVTSFADSVPSLYLSPSYIYINDNDGLILSLEHATYTVTESSQYVEICIVAYSSDPNLAATAQGIISTQNSTAQDGRDYSGTVQMLTLSVGSRECISISIVDDETLENSEIFLVVLTNSSNVDLDISLAQIQIEDDDIGTSSAFIQLQLIGIGNCITWKSTDREAKIRGVTENILDQIPDSLCGTGCEVEITEQGFYCINSDANIVTFRARLTHYMYLVSTGSEIADVIAHLEDWKNGGPSITVEFEGLKVDPSCNMEIEDFGDPACSPTTETSDSGSDSQTTVIGASIGGVVGGVIVGAVLTFSIVFAVWWCMRKRGKGEITTEQSLQQLIASEEPISGTETGKPQEA